ncbi:hypothetical protein [Pedobacter sp. SL55]|uniref:hypothetical protein n=1 Tax=Pedobacter sp. SL55 TaxID=2995161 RepID=UPI0022710665|nr:hypothetical protein [Pedobacter sp. SL55]WAC42096.1 hypothetical protein OVA16_07005 [Pedobacter sp. SL55]
MKPLLIALLCICFSQTFAQTIDETFVKETVNQLFEGMRKNDRNMMLGTLHKSAVIQYANQAIRPGEDIKPGDSAEAFVNGYSKFNGGKIDEQITINKILIDDELASVWVNYKCYMNNRLLFCGVKSIQLIKNGLKWKISYIVENRRKYCE